MDNEYHDIFSPEKRSEIMSLVRSRNTKPELQVRSALHRLGYRFRVHRRDLPGSPDIVLPKYRTVVFVHGCFWHQHEGCRKATIPRTNHASWKHKLERNVERDREAAQKLENAGWEVEILWECELQKEAIEVIVRLDNRLQSRLTELQQNRY